MDFSRDKMVARYYELCDERDAAYAKAQPHETRLDELNRTIQTLQADAAAEAARIEAAWGSDHFKRKKEIAEIARFLVRIPPRPTVNAA